MQSVFRIRPPRLLPAVALAAACAALTGCVVAPAYPAYGGDYVSGDVYAPMAPPPLRAEVIPIAPSPAYVWIGGS
ncbi:MAG: hypothetical protein RR283_01485, partial [Comamonas sp.]